ncbi:Uncharacterised protein [Staphylococcus aureus]|uniref:hypothetical protein n=1 Tax=Staphylococcus aureus TaxID=1280 RepID=UPI000A49EFB8|nr:hypothetical protein [Staphylococcus aureus]MEC6083911.1 hypothetical protein [Staphylococcus aureus]CAC7012256.1 Uncharacterised protein [Staphylococcus aureus]HCU9716193.1 hypothetical protein [Staphylococcus aureus]HCX2553856.1 hypothetical protein [Staphylococcus aureus]
MYHYERVRKTFAGIFIGLLYFIGSLFLVSWIGLKMFNSGMGELIIILLTIAQIFALRLVYRSIVAPVFIKYEKR